MSTKSIPYIYQKFKSMKARFFITENGIAGNFGFWIPKKCILNQSDISIEVPSWFKPKIIQID